MPLHNYINRIRRLDALIRRKSTGPPRELAEKLDISERWLYVLMDELKEELDCPIRYDRTRRSYIYNEPGKVMIGFKKEIDKTQMKRISGGEIFRTSEVAPIGVVSKGRIIYSFRPGTVGAGSFGRVLHQKSTRIQEIL